MAHVIHENGIVFLRLSFLEQLGSFHRSPQAFEKDLVNTYVVSDVWSAQHLRGVRAPGTGFPFLIMLGTMRYRGGKDFCAIYKRRPVRIYEFSSGPFKRWIVSQPAEVRSKA